jgi:hypothetical protein
MAELGEEQISTWLELLPQRKHFECVDVSLDDEIRHVGSRVLRKKCSTKACSLQDKSTRREFMTWKGDAVWIVALSSASCRGTQLADKGWLLLGSQESVAYLKELA